MTASFDSMPLSELYGDAVESESEGMAIYRHYPSFIRLFRYEIDVLLEGKDIRKVLRRHFKKLLDTNFYDEFRKKELATLDEDKQLTEETKYCFYVAIDRVHDAHAPFWYWLQEELLKLVGGEHERFAHDGYLVQMLKQKPEFEADNFAKFFNRRYPRILDVIVRVLNVDRFIHYIGLMNVKDYEQYIFKAYVNDAIAQCPHDHHYVACELMRRWFYTRPPTVNNKQHSWYWDFVASCSQHADNAGFLCKLDSGYEKGLYEYVTGLEAKVREHLLDTNSNIIDPSKIYDQPFHPQTSRKALAYFAFDSSSALELRNYQEELAVHANAGINTVISAPTGCGKTIVAIDIIKKHLAKNKLEDGTLKESTRVFFVVPTVPLVNQQQTLIKNYSTDGTTVNGFHGGDGRSANIRLKDMLRSHVIVTTPQLLYNMMSSVFVTERVNVSDITLMIFDECHHCNANHPYALVMQILRDYAKAYKANTSRQPPPQVVGLTASLGTGNSYANPQSTVEHMLELCVRMMATQISTVHTTAALATLREFVNPPTDEIIRCPRPADPTPYRQRILQCLDDTLEHIRDDFNALKKAYPPLSQLHLDRPAEITFTSQVETLFESSPRWPEEFAERRPYILSAIEYLRVYLHALRVDDLHISAYSLHDLEKQISVLASSVLSDNNYDEDDHVNEIDTFRQSLYTVYKTPLKSLRELANRDDGKKKRVLVALVKLLDEEYTRRPDTRAIIFVEHREHTKYLAEFLSSHPQLETHFTRTSVQSLTSTNQSMSTGGMSVRLQHQVLKGFKNNTVKVVVATSVAEEGMDISECNLIVKYNVVGSERTMIQRRGRARAYDSRSYLLAIDESVETREMTNVMRETMMHKCLDNLRAKSDSQLRNEIAGQAAHMEKAEAEEKRVREERLRGFSDALYELRCLKCQEKLCDSQDMRQLQSYYVSMNAEVWKALRIGITNTPRIEGVVANCSPVLCKHCDARLGNVICLSNVIMPAFTCSYLTFADTRRPDENYSSKKWTDVVQKYFIIADCSVDNMVSMANSLYEHSPEDFQHVRDQQALAVQRSIEAIKRRKERKMRFKMTYYEDADENNFY